MLNHRIPKALFLVLCLSAGMAAGMADGTAPARHGEPPSKAGKRDQNRPQGEGLLQGLHRRVFGLKHIRHEAVREGDVETVRKVDDLVAKMVGTLDGAFPDLVRRMDEQEARQKAENPTLDSARKDQKARMQADLRSKQMMERQKNERGGGEKAMPEKPENR